MDFTLAFAFLTILAGNFLLSLGMVLQKLAVSGLTAEGARKKPPRLVIVWGMGFILINLVPVFQYFSLKYLSTQAVGAAMGANVIFTLVLSALVLKEHITRTAAAWAAVMVLAIAAASILPQSSGTSFSIPFTLASGLIPFFFLLLVPLVSKASSASVFGATTGALNGFMVIAMKVLSTEGAFGMQGVFASPVLWGLLYFFSGFFALVFTQLAYARGPMRACAPFIYGMQVIWPVLASYFVFAAPFAPLSAAAFVLVAVSAIMIQRSATVDSKNGGH